MNMFKQLSTIMTMHGKQVCDQWDLVQFSDSRVKSLQWDVVSLFFGSIDTNEVSKCALLNSPHNSIMEFMI